MQVQVGELVGRGRTSDVFGFGKDSVVKVANPGVPADWPTFEAALTRAVREMGVAAPEVRDVIEIDGRPAVVFERIDGPSMWQQIVAEPQRGPELVAQLAAIQKSLHEVAIPRGVPELVDRLVRKIDLARGLSDAERADAIQLAEMLPRGAALLHGDLHPGNVLMGVRGPVVIDWFDAAIGHPVADIVRSSMLLQPNPVAAPRHLPGAYRALLDQAHRTYLRDFAEELDFVGPDLPAWRGVVAAGRLAEGAEVDERFLLDIIRAAH